MMAYIRNKNMASHNGLRTILVTYRYSLEQNAQFSTHTPQELNTDPI
jgi:hypothetical protein